jgi:cell wall-associated NlpC family hydrolase
MVTGLFLAPSAEGYSGSQAAAYADQWATSRNSHYMRFSSDCANFVSQSLRAGGTDFAQNGQNANSDYAWWMNASNRTYSTTWVNAYRLSRFIDRATPGGYMIGGAKGTSTNYYTPSNVVTGDLLFYDWGQGEGISHVAIQVGVGYDLNITNQTWYGNYVDQHTSDRKHAFWSLYAYNGYRNSTYIYFKHMNRS